jgi:hypothetical protein
MLFSEGNSARPELAGARTLGSGVVLLSYQVPGAERHSAPGTGR